ncbi:trafficking protein particle complex subunit 8-like isoform X1 [Camellia sinensis]|uniref:trafficking protein particle complex subunit 8-like isoform X1 n=1 Tax=Camellia sinensis TaxID=4442 RepID=UPI00103602EA|nr:trafficking protein particle complex subunit 8-like isoform X1 [Camellia sinensis]
MLKTRDQFKEATTVYFRISGEEPLHLAVMLEQASCCYLFAKPPMLRKYGFHLVLSGDLYKKCDQMKHAIRTYRGALTVFKGTKWSHIRDHVHFHIGKWKTKQKQKTLTNSISNNNFNQGLRDLLHSGDRRHVIRTRRLGVRVENALNLVEKCALRGQKYETVPKPLWGCHRQLARDKYDLLGHMRCN